MAGGAAWPITPPGSEATKPGGISNRGEIVGTGYPDLDRPNEGFGYLRRRDGSYTTIRPPGADLRTAPAGINDNGEIAGLYVDAGGRYHGFVRDRWGRYSTIDHPDASGTSPQGSGTAIWSINDHGTVSGHYIDGDGSGHCFIRDRRGRMTTLDHPDADGTTTPLGSGTGYCVTNDDGDIAGIYSDDGTVHSFLRDERGRYTVIDVPGAVLTVPNALNDRGQLAGTYYVATAIDAPDGVNHGFIRDRRGNYTTIDHPQAVASGTSVFGLNDHGQAVGTYASPL